MKISEMSTVKAASVMAKILHPIRNILQDEEVIPAVQRVISSREVGDLVSAFLSDAAPMLLEKHTEDFCTIVAALAGKKTKAVMDQNILITFQDIRDSVDKDLVDFFKSSGIARTNEEEKSAPSSSDTAGTEEKS